MKAKSRDTGWHRESPSSGLGRVGLALGPVTPEDLANLEQRDVVKATIGVLLGRGDKARNQAWAHVGKSLGDRIGEHELVLAAAEQFGMAMRHERPGHRFGHGAACEGA